MGSITLYANCRIDAAYGYLLKITCQHENIVKNMNMVQKLGGHRPPFLPSE